jgi:hypothetical protein
MVLGSLGHPVPEIALSWWREKRFIPNMETTLWNLFKEVSHATLIASYDMAHFTLYRGKGSEERPTSTVPPREWVKQLEVEEQSNGWIVK